jgi:segregation and condensation protein B
MTDTTPIDVLLESVLFHKSEPLKITDLAKIVGVDTDTVKQGLAELKEKLEDRGVVLIIKDGQAMLGTSPKSAFLIEELIKAELDRDLGKAGLETLSIVLYKGPISRPDIDYIRGVNSSFILRNLLIRGLIERVAKGKRFLYRPTFELLSYLGITDVAELPEYGDVVAQMKEALEVEKEQEKETNE